MVLCSGVFDGLHAGHVSYLRSAAGLRLAGESLMVAVAPDAYVRRAKLKTPRWPLGDRLLTVAALDMVHEVGPHSDAGVADVILAHHPRLFVKGADWKGRLCADVLAACQQVGAEIVYVAERATKHTSQVA